MSHIEYEQELKRKNRIKLLSHALAAVNILIGFFCLWEFAAAMRFVIGFSTEIYWLSKAWWQQVSFILVAILFMAVTLFGQHLYEKAMLRKGHRLPLSYIVITACELMFVLIYRLISR